MYADFYSSDIIIASPLGLRMIIGAEGERSREYDFLASIELVILDQTELFLMQVSKHRNNRCILSNSEILYLVKKPEIDDAVHAPSTQNLVPSKSD